VIRVLVVDDDFRVAQVHARFAERVPGFEVVAVAHSAAQAREAAAAHRPDLVLLDVYLPDEPGTALLGELDADAIVLTAAAEAATVRAALARGALNYLIKPFSAAQLAARLTAYARYREVLARRGELAQSTVDGAVQALHAGDVLEPRMPKGQSPVTAQLVADALRGAGHPRSASDIATALGIARGTAQRYLSVLARGGRAQMTLRYGATGRPEHLYRWLES
jgi:response regulator of citrate/malate metabolism